MEEAQDLANRALSLQPENTVALGVLGVASFEAGDYSAAERYWSDLLELTPVGSPIGT